MSQAQGEKSALQARLASYAIFGERPLPVAGIILVTAAAVALLVIILVIVLQLAL